MEQTLSASCVAARAQVRRFLDSSSAVGRAKVLPPREHLAQCPACNDEYRALVQGVARISRGARESDTAVDDAMRTSHARRNLIAADPRRKLRLPRSILPLALVAVFAVLIARSGADQVVIQALGGGVYRGATAVVAGSSVAVKNGDGCSTGPDGRAIVGLGANAIHFEPDSSFLIERLDQLAVRMFTGRASVDGDALILVSSGALQTRGGSARIAIDESGGLVECVTGAVEYTDASGRHALSIGESRPFTRRGTSDERE